jgi:ribonuclease HII
MACGLRFEKHLWSTGIPIVAGIDEAGRGPLAGPVVAAAAVLPAEFSLPGLNDSKQLAEAVREQFFEALTAPGKLVCYGVGIAEPAEIDRLNILRATFLAMERAITALPIQPDHLLIDGLPVPVFRQPQTALVGGDGKSKSIAAASVIAKVTRDRMMRKWHGEFPQYDFEHNKGYGTPAHLESLQIHGPCAIHRRSFAPVAQTYFLFH